MLLNAILVERKTRHAPKCLAATLNVRQAGHVLSIFYLKLSENYKVQKSTCEFWEFGHSITKGWKAGLEIGYNKPSPFMDLANFTSFLFWWIFGPDIKWVITGKANICVAKNKFREPKSRCWRCSVFSHDLCLWSAPYEYISSYAPGPPWYICLYMLMLVWRCLDIRIQLKHSRLIHLWPAPWNAWLNFSFGSMFKAINVWGENISFVI